MVDLAYAASEQVLTFRVADEHFSLPASKVREVVRLTRVTRVPHAPGSLLGVTNLRGNVLSLVALGALIGRPISPDGPVIVLERAEPVGLLVDAVIAVVGRTQSEAASRVLDLDTLLGDAFRVRSAPIAARTAIVSANDRIETAPNEIVLVVFAVGSQEYGLPIAQIDQIVSLPRDVTLLPKADEAVIGSFAWQGGILPLLSLQRLLGLGAGNANERQRVVVARIGSHKIGLLVDAIRSVLRVDESLIDAIPEVLSRRQGETRIQAICRLDEGRRLVSVLATEHLVRTELTDRRSQHEGGEGQTMTAVDLDSAGDQFLIFQLGAQDFGVPIEVVWEVTNLPDKLTRVPKAPAFVEGVMNLRGEVIAVIDQRRRFQGEAALGKRRRVVVVSLGDLRVGFVVDSVSEVLRVPSSSIRATPALGDERTKVFDRIANIEDSGRMILLVDPPELLDRAERDLVLALANPEGAGSL